MVKKSAFKKFPLLFVILAICIVSVLILILHFTKTSKVLYSWTEVGTNNHLIARSITTSSECPKITIDGSTTQMSKRAGPSETSKVTTCEQEIPENAKSVTINKQPLKLIPSHPKKILVIGDAGCRLKGDDIQNCDDPKDWPFAQIAKVAASMSPDLIIHVGDNLYRQDPCPAGDKGCQGSPFGNDWQTWQADFFDPALPLLKLAPWVIVRGNHETCSRAGLLWFEYLAPQKFTGECEAYSDPYFINFDNINFLNVDSAQASDFATKSDEVKRYQDSFTKLSNLPESTWMITHRPLWGVKFKEDGGEEDDPTEQIPDGFIPLRYANGTLPKQNLVGFNKTLQASITPNLLNSLQVILSGHYHNFQTLNFDGVVPPQLTVGNSGTKLEEEITESLDNLVIDGHTVKNSSYLNQFGFVMLEEQPDGSWKATEYDVNGKEMLTCTIKDRNISCAP